MVILITGSEWTNWVSKVSPDRDVESSVSTIKESIDIESVSPISSEGTYSIPLSSELELLS